MAHETHRENSGVIKCLVLDEATPKWKLGQEEGKGGERGRNWKENLADKLKNCGRRWQCFVALR